MKKRIGLVILLLCIFLLQFAAFLVFHSIDSNAEVFLERGKEVTDVFEKLAKALLDDDFSALQQAYSTRFQGQALGLASPGPAQERAGVRRAILGSPTGDIDRVTALEEWRDYLEDFQSIDEAIIELHQLEDWENDDDMTAIARFELIGRLKDQTSPTVDRAYIRWRLRREGQRLRFTDAVTLRGERQQALRPLFTDVTEQSGLPAAGRRQGDGADQASAQPLHFPWMLRLKGGIAAADYDNDLFEDLFIADGGQARLFRNLGRLRFKDVTAAAGLDGLEDVQVAVFADYDNDGDKDLFLGRSFEHDQLFRSNGDGTFIEVTGQAGLPSAGCCTTAASWADYDNDGDLDLYVGRYLDPRLNSPDILHSANGLPNLLFRNEGDGTFSEQAPTAGVADRGLCMAAVWGDADGDGFADLYVANDFGPDIFYRNNGDGSFSDMTRQVGLFRYGSSMGAFLADLNNDGRLDIYVSRVRSPLAWTASTPTLQRFLLDRFRQRRWGDVAHLWRVWRDTGQLAQAFDSAAMGNRLWQNLLKENAGTQGMEFRDTSWDSNAGPPGWFFGSAAADFDRDGYLDIYSAGGWPQDLEKDRVVSSRSPGEGNPLTQEDAVFYDAGSGSSRPGAGYQRNRLLRNNHSGAFNEIGIPAGAALQANGRGVALADFRNQGRIDIVVAQADGGVSLLHNGLDRPGNWLSLLLVGGDSNRDAVGARVTLRAGDSIQVREVASAQGFASQSSLRLFFGLGEAESVDEIAVVWPATGRQQKFEKLSVNQLLRISEEEDQPKRLNPHPR